MPLSRHLTAKRSTYKLVVRLALDLKMDKTEAYKIAQQRLLEIADREYALVAKLVGSVVEEQVQGESRALYGVDIYYRWTDKPGNDISIKCNVAAKNWYRHDAIVEKTVVTASVTS